MIKLFQFPRFTSSQTQHYPSPIMGFNRDSSPSLKSNDTSQQMSDNTSIFVRYNKTKMGFEVIHASWDAQNDNEVWENAEYFMQEITALRFAVQKHISLKASGVTPEYGITPLYDPDNLLPREQKTLTDWYEEQIL